MGVCRADVFRYRLYRYSASGHGCCLSHHHHTTLSASVLRSVSVFWSVVGLLRLAPAPEVDGGPVGEVEE